MSAVVVTHNSAGCITACLTALTEEVKSVGGDVIVFDNKSDDTTVQEVRAKFPAVIIHQSGKNIGFGTANNEAAKMARGEYLLFANPDMIIDRGALSRLVTVLGDKSDAGAAVARMRNPDDSFQPTCRRLPTMRNIFFSRGSLLALRKTPIASRERYTLGDYGEVTEVPAAAATCMLIERDFFQWIGGFDGRFFLFMEDTDLCLRIGQVGRKVYFVPGAGAVHLWGKGTSTSSLKRCWYHHISVWKYFLKHYPNGFSLFLLPAVLLLNFLIGSLLGLGWK